MRDDKETQNTETEATKKPSPHPDPLPSHPMGAERGQQSANGSGGDEREAAGESGRALRGKIARLPKHVREELNRRMDDGESGSSLTKWLNELPAVKNTLAKYFGGTAIIEKNISNWRAGGHKRWMERHELLDEIRELAEEAEDFSRVAGENFARRTASIAAVKILKMLHAIKPEDCTATELVKIAHATVALAQVEHANERLKNEKTRVYQGNERLVLSWDKHLRGCVATAQRVMDDDMAKSIQHSDIDNSQKIELLGHYLFKDKWCLRKVGSTHGVRSPDGPPSEASTQDNAEHSPHPEPAQDSNLNDSPSSSSASAVARAVADKKATEDRPHPDPLPSRRMGAERGQPADGVHGLEFQQQSAVVPTTLAPDAADQEVSPTMTHVSPVVVKEGEANPLAYARGSVEASATEGAGSKTGETPIPPAEPEPEFLRSDIERLVRFQGKTLEEAQQILRARFKAWKAWRKNGSMGPNPMHAAPEPNYFAPNPGPTPPLYGPCEPPATSSSLRNLW